MLNPWLERPAGFTVFVPVGHVPSWLGFAGALVAGSKHLFDPNESTTEIPGNTGEPKRLIPAWDGVNNCLFTPYSFSRINPNVWVVLRFGLIIQVLLIVKTWLPASSS